MTTTPADPFGTGPFQSLLNALHLPAGREHAVIRRAIWSIVVAWVPLVVLSYVEQLALTGGPDALLQDYAAFARYLLAVPLLVVAEAPARRWLTRVSNHFLDARLVADEDRPAFEELLASSDRLLSSRLALVAILVLAYLTTLASAREWVVLGAAGWMRHSRDGDAQVVLSWAGWWRLLVSQPLFMSLTLSWFWRLFVWFRCVRGIARLKIRIVASHPDRAGGLGFLGQALRAFPVMAMGMGTAIAGTLANLMVHEREASTSLTPVVVGTVVFILFICAGPLLSFVKPMLEAQDDAQLTYGALATTLGERFEDRWLNRAPTLDSDALGVPDFSATADLYSVTAHVDEMRFVPIEIRDFVPLLLCTLLPFLPIILRQVSFDEILAVAKRLLM